MTPLTKIAASYLDYNATCPLKPVVRDVVLGALELSGNPSSVHGFGRKAKQAVDAARQAVAALVGVKPTHIIFTGGGTEANNLALTGIDAAEILVSAIEHDSVLSRCAPNFRLPVTRAGLIDLAAAEAILKAASKPSLISVMMVNNETGVIQPVADLAQLAKKYGHKIHTDAVQAAGRLPIDFTSMGVDAMTLSAHKIGGPQGVGALIVAENLPVKAQQTGGGQEMNRRAGTENVAGISGFGVAAQCAVSDMGNNVRLMQMRDELQKQLIAYAGEGAVVIGGEAPRVANTLNIAMCGVSSETQVAALDLSGVCVSAGSACSSGKVKASHVLRAMGYGDDVAGSGLRISLGWNTTEADIQRCADAWKTLYNRAGKKNFKAA